VAHRNVVGLAVGVNNLEIQHLDVGAAHVQADGFETTLAAANWNGVAIATKQGNLLATKLDPSTGAGWRWRRGCLGQTFHTNDGLPAAEVRHRAIDHLDAVDNAVGAAQIKRVCAIAPPQHAPNGNVVGLAVTVHHLEVEHFDIATTRVQANGAEATVASPDTQDIAIHTERNGLTTEVHPVAVSALGKGVARHHPREY
jgi:hypothetical protein